MIKTPAAFHSLAHIDQKKGNVVLKFEWKNKIKQKFKWPLQRRRLSDKHLLLLTHFSHYVSAFFRPSCKKKKTLAGREALAEDKKHSGENEMKGSSVPEARPRRLLF